MGNAAHELKLKAKLRGWKQAPPNDEDGVAVVLEAATARLASLPGPNPSTSSGQAPGHPA